jgi:carbon storage regulator CsrA
VLVLRRRLDESIDMVLDNGESVSVTVVDIGYNWVKLGFTAPNNVSIVRDDAVNKDH